MSQRDALVITWGKCGSLQTALAAIRSDASVILRIEGWRGRVIGRHLPRLTDPTVKFGWRDLLLMIATLRGGPEALTQSNEIR